MDPVSAGGSDDVAAVMVRYQSLMRTIIDTQRDVVLSVMGAAPTVVDDAAEGRGPSTREPAAAQSAARMPLVDPGAVREAAPGVFEFSRRLRSDRDLYLSDHRLDGRPVFPAAMAMELMAEVAQACSPRRRVTEIRDFTVLKGVVLQERALGVRVIARRTAAAQEAEVTRFQMEIFADDDRNRLRYRAIVDTADEGANPGEVAPSHLGGLAELPLSPSEAYDRWLFHGPLFASVASIAGVSGDGIRATLRPSTAGECVAGAAASEWLIDPIVIDGSFQMVIMWSRHCNDMTPLPSRFRRYRSFAPFKRGEVQCDVSVASSTSGHTLTTRHLFCAADGSVLGLLEGMESTCSRDLNRLAGSSRQPREAP